MLVNDSCRPIDVDSIVELLSPVKGNVEIRMEQNTPNIYPYHDVGERLREMRKLMGISQDQLARILEVSAQAVSFYEVGRRPISRRTLIRLHEMGVRLAWLQSGQGEPFRGGEIPTYHGPAASLHVEEASPTYPVASAQAGMSVSMEKMSELVQRAVLLFEEEQATMPPGRRLLSPQDKAEYIAILAEMLAQDEAAGRTGAVRRLLRKAFEIAGHQPREGVAVGGLKVPGPVESGE